MAEFKIPQIINRKTNTNCQPAKSAAERKSGKRKRLVGIGDEVRSEVIINSVFLVIKKSKTGRFSSICALLRVSSESGAKALVGYQLRLENKRKPVKHKKKSPVENIVSGESDYRSAPATVGTFSEGNVFVCSTYPSYIAGLTSDSNSLDENFIDDTGDYPPAIEILEILNSVTLSDFSSDDSCYISDNENNSTVNEFVWGTGDSLTAESPIHFAVSESNHIGEHDDLSNSFSNEDVTNDDYPPAEEILDILFSIDISYDDSQIQNHSFDGSDYDNPLASGILDDSCYATDSENNFAADDSSVNVTDSVTAAFAMSGSKCAGVNDDLANNACWRLLDSFSDDDFANGGYPPAQEILEILFSINPSYDDSGLPNGSYEGPHDDYSQESGILDKIQLLSITPDGCNTFNSPQVEGDAPTRVKI